MSQTRIDKLTKSQEALMSIIRDEWIKIGLDTSPTDKQKAEEAIALAYECAGLKPPQKILWFNNPVDAETYIASDQGILGKAIGDTVFYAVGDAVNDVIRAAVGDAVRAAVDVAVRVAVDDVIRAAGWDHVEIAVQDAVKAAVGHADAVWDLARDGFSGPLVVGWLAYHAYFDAIGFDCPKLKGLWATAKHCGWWWAFEYVAVVTSKPRVICSTQEGILR